MRTARLSTVACKNNVSIPAATEFFATPFLACHAGGPALPAHALAHRPSVLERHPGVGKGDQPMHPTEKIVRQVHESWDMRDPDRGAALIVVDCDFENVACRETLPGKAAEEADCHRWREAFPDGPCEVETVLVSRRGKWPTVEFRIASHGVV